MPTSRRTGTRRCLAATSSSPVTCSPNPSPAEDVVCGGPYTVGLHAIIRPSTSRSRGTALPAKLRELRRQARPPGRAAERDLAYHPRAPARRQEAGPRRIRGEAHACTYRLFLQFKTDGAYHRAVHGRGAGNESRRIPIEGMTCATCASRIERQAEQLDGVTATVNYATEKLRSEYDRRSCAGGARRGRRAGRLLGAVPQKRRLRRPRRIRPRRHAADDVNVHAALTSAAADAARSDPPRPAQAPLPAQPRRVADLLDRLDERLGRTTSGRIRPQLLRRDSSPSL